MKSSRSITVKCKKLISCLCAVLIATTIFGTTVFADDYDPNKTGSIALTLQQEDKDGNIQTYSGIDIALYKVGSATYDTGAMIFSLDSGFESAGLDLNNMQKASDWVDAATTLSGMVSSSGVSADVKVTDDAGKITYSDLAQGVYLLVQNTANETISVSPMVLTIPYIEETEWTYDITSYPKFTTTVKPTTTPSKTPSKVDSGDRTNIIMWSEVLIGAAIVLIITVHFARKKKNSKIK